MTGFTAASLSGSLWLGVLAAVLTGMLMGALHALFTVALGLSQHVCGIGVTLFSSGLAYFLYRLIFGQQSVPPSIKGFQTLPIPLLSDIPVLGPAVFNQFALVYMAIIAIPLAAFVLYRTPWGLSVRMVGENPRAADSAGVSVIATRFQAVILGGALMGLAGAFLIMAQFNAFTFGVVSGRGWVAIALVVFGRWDPWRSAGAALLFAFVDALQLRMQASGLGHIPYEAFLMLPFIFTIVAMAVMSRNAVAPSALLKPFRREERWQGMAIEFPLHHIAVKPLSTNRCAPLTKLDSSLARIKRGLRHLFRLADATLLRGQCRVGDIDAEPAEIGDLAQAVRRADEAGADGVAADVAVAELDGDGAREHVAGALGGVVEHLHRRRRHRRDRRGADDRAAAGRYHAGQHGARHQEHRARH